MAPKTERRTLGEGEKIDAPCTLWMPHLDAEGARAVKMIGKVVRHRDQLVLFHAQSGTQYHRKYDCPAPIDLRIATLLNRSGMDLIYMYDRQFSEIWRTDLERLKDAHIAFYDGRNRLYLPRGGWDRMIGVQERQDGPQTVYERVVTAPDEPGRVLRRTPILSVPFLPLELVVEELGTF